MTPPPPRSPFWGDHQPRRRLGDNKRRSDVQTEQQVEGRLVDFEKGLRTVDTGIVDQDVETTKAGEGVADHVRAGDVERQRPRLAAAFSDIACDLVELALGPAHQYQFGAGGGERYATARPIPRPAPVTSAVLPSTRNAIGGFPA